MDSKITKPCQRPAAAMSSLNDRLLALLECPVCLEIIQPPILSCTNGHLVCTACHKRLPSCGLCRADFATGPNVLAEKVAYELEYPCPNAGNGCQEFVRTELMRGHVSSCNFDCRCLVHEYAVVYGRNDPSMDGFWKVTKCVWVGRREALKQHVLDTHGDSYMGDAGQLTDAASINQLKTDYSAKLVALGGELFWIILHFAKADLQFVGRVLHLGPPEKSRGFYYKFKFPPKAVTGQDFSHKELSPRITFRGRIVSDKTEVEEVKRESLVLPSNFVEDLATESHILNYSVVIRQFADD